MTLFRSGIVVAFFTFISRFFGLLRELFVAALFGATSTADSVNIAFKLPNLFRRIFGEGALSSVFVPIFNEKMLVSRQEAQKFTGEIFTLLLVVLIILTVLMQVLMPSLMFAIAPGFHKDPIKFELTVLLCRITMPYLIFISIAALLGGILNSVKKFAAFAFMPVLMSVGVIVFTLILNKYRSAAISISLSLVISGIMQALFMFCCLARAGLLFQIKLKAKDKDVKKFLTNMGPAALGSGAQQLNLFVSQSIASFIPGAVSILSYADRIYQFPLSIIGVTFSTILLPELSKLYKLKDFVGAAKVETKSIKTSLLLSLPAALGIILLAQPIIHIIYERGAFDPTDTAKTADAIAAYALGLPAFIIARIMLPIFYANHNTRTPLRITIYTMLANIILNMVLMVPYSHVGIALGSSIAAWYNVWLLYSYAKDHYGFKIDPEIKWFALKVLVGCCFMSIFILSIDHYYGSYFYSNSLFIKTLALAGTIGGGGAIFFGVAAYFKLHTILLKK